MFRKSESSSLLRDEFLDLNDSVEVDNSFWHSAHSLINCQLIKPRICALTAITALVCAALLGWSALAVSKSTSALHPSTRDHFKRNQQMQASDWGKSAVASSTYSAQRAVGLQGDDISVLLELRSVPAPYGSMVRQVSLIVMREGDRAQR